MNYVGNLTRLIPNNFCLNRELSKGNSGAIKAPNLKRVEELLLGTIPDTVW